MALKLDFNKDIIKMGCIFLIFKILATISSNRRNRYLTENVYNISRLHNEN